MIDNIKIIGKLVEEHAKNSMNPDKFEQEILKLKRNQRKLARLEQWLRKHYGGIQQNLDVSQD